MFGTESLLLFLIRIAYVGAAHIRRERFLKGNAYFRPDHN